MSDVVNALYRLYKENVGCDFKVVSSDGVVLEVHEIILAARSEVLKTLITAESKEKETKTIVFQKASSDVVDAFICFLYTDKTPDTFDKIKDLMELGHKYDVQALVEYCGSKVGEDLNMHNFRQVAAMGEEFGASCLIDKCATFFIQNRSKFPVETLGGIPLKVLGKVYIMKTSESCVSDKSYEAILIHNDLKKKYYRKSGEVTTWTFEARTPLVLHGFSFLVDQELKEDSTTLDEDSDNEQEEKCLPNIIFLEHSLMSKEKILYGLTSNQVTKCCNIMLPQPVGLAAGESYTFRTKFDKDCFIYQGPDEAKCYGREDGPQIYISGASNISSFFVRSC